MIYIFFYYVWVFIEFFNPILWGFNQKNDRDFWIFMHFAEICIL